MIDHFEQKVPCLKGLLTSLHNLGPLGLIATPSITIIASSCDSDAEVDKFHDYFVNTTLRCEILC